MGADTPYHRNLLPFNEADKQENLTPVSLVPLISNEGSAESLSSHGMECRVGVINTGYINEISWLLVLCDFDLSKWSFFSSSLTIKN